MRQNQITLKEFVRATREGTWTGGTLIGDKDSDG